MIALNGLFKKELKVAFTTPVAYVVFFLFTLLASMLFWFQLRQYEQLVQRTQHMSDPELLAQLNFNDVILTELFINVQIVFIFLLPILTMRAFAEERKQKTMELLMTSPITTTTVIIGKFAAAMVLVLCLTGILTVYPGILSVYGTTTLVGENVVDWWTCGLGMLGVFLCGAMFTALGFFFSSLTESQILSALLTFFTLLLLWFMGGASASVPGVTGSILGYLSPLNHLGQFARGVLHIGDVGYYLTFTGVFLFMTYRSVEGQRWG